MVRTRVVTLSFLLTALLALNAGAAPGQTEHSSPSSSAMTEIAALYRQATGHHRRAVRKPIRDARARAFKALAAKADALLIEADKHAGDQGSSEFCQAMRGLQAAARASDLPELRRQYAAVITSVR